MKFEHIKSFADLADLVGDITLESEMTLRQLNIVNGDLCAGESVHFYRISNPDILLKHSNELVFYDDELCIYLWGIKTPFDTDWKLVPAPELHE